VPIRLRSDVAKLSKKIGFRKDIQILRGIAVLAVVLFHAKEDYFPLGYLGVDVFFVISGFVVTPLILKIFTEKDREGGQLGNLINFYKRRFYRLAPALTCTLVCSAILIFLLGPVADHQRFARQGISTLLLIGNFGGYSFSGDYFAPNPNPLVHTWSLSVEEQIYVLLPLALFLILYKRRNIAKFIALIFVVITSASFFSFQSPNLLQPLYSVVGIEMASQFSFYSPIDRIWQFTLGGLGYLMVNKFGGFASKLALRISPILTFSIIILLLGPFTFSPKSSSIFATLIAFVSIALGSSRCIPEILGTKLEWLGNRSYSIYLVHMPLIYIAKFSPAVQISGIENRIIQSFLAVVASLYFGSLSYSKIENKFRNKHLTKTINVRSVSGAVVATFVFPSILFVSIDIGQRNHYWGLDRNVHPPSYAGLLDPNCERDSLSGPPCMYLNKSAVKTVLLIGDSHAGHLSQAVIDASKNQNWNAVIWTHSGCHVQFKRSLKNLISDNCIAANLQMKAWVLANKPSAIIISQFVYLDSFIADLTHAIADLHSIVPNILLIENSLVFPDQKDFMVPRPLIMAPYKAPKKFLKTMMLERDNKASDELANWANHNYVETINFESLFCIKNECVRFSEAGWLYRDDDHFSVAGAALTIPQFENFLERF
jgi:peptidoglycan/LPS O-acetylase OafA/YrhL